MVNWHYFIGGMMIIWTLISIVFIMAAANEIHVQKFTGASAGREILSAIGWATGLTVLIGACLLAAIFFFGMRYARPSVGTYLERMILFG